MTQLRGIRRTGPPGAPAWKVWRASSALVAAITFFLAAASARAQSVPRISHQVVGLHEAYVAQKGDTLQSLSSRHGIPAAILARENGLALRARLKAGQELRIDDRHIVPADLDDGILINLPQLMLFFLQHGQLKAAFPAALGKPSWPTPRGPFQVLELREHPVWRVPPSIQREMAMEGRVVKTAVPPGPDNPLGDFFIALSLGNVGVHSTNAPLTIYGFRTHGCIRLHPDDARELFDQVEPGQPGEIIYQPVLLARLDDGRVFLEVHRDIYGLVFRSLQFVHDLAEANAIDGIDWDKVRDVMDFAEGIARDVTRRDSWSNATGN